VIGVIAKSQQKAAVEEFFQLFKVPWEYYDYGKSYDVIISTDIEIQLPYARLVIIFGSETTLFDRENGIEVSRCESGVLLHHEHFQFPVYGNLAIFHAQMESFIEVKDDAARTGIALDRPDKRILRIGYDLFDEIAFLLSPGQTVEYAHIPTVEVHISLLRDWILKAGLPLLEIPPVPAGYAFTVCLTHDVDFIGIRNHKFDRSFVGFILRVLFPFAFRGYSSRISLSKYMRNLKALLSLPGVYLGLFRDFWFQLDRYMEIEKGLSSTFFFIPFKDHPGYALKGKPLKYRSARYDVNDYKVHIESLLRGGHEIGIHGLDAWHDSLRGRKELEVIREITGEEEAAGVRMHWLYFSGGSPGSLEDAGFKYDSSMGFNDAVGYRCGTTQVFLLPGTSELFELPLHVQDTAMFYPNRMGLSESQALGLCEKLIGDVRSYGGALAVNWHQRSLGPERNWDDFYVELLKIFKNENVWFATAGQTVNWFRKRRSVHYDEVGFSGNNVEVKLKASVDNDSPHLMLRIHHPRREFRENGESHDEIKSFVDVPFSARPEIGLTVDLTSPERPCHI
jgi:hypothetical protein